jgi:uncharacterized protein (DUF983 family)
MRRFHLWCDTPVVYDEVSTGYSCACPDCDEDLYLFETYLKEVIV